MTRCCLVVTTYERPDALARVLESMATQRRPPDELVVADDGSGGATAEVVRHFAASVRYRVRHAWQHHEGFRAGRIRNAAIAGTTCEYVVLLDGDMVVHPDFIADHLEFARRGRYSQGVRILLDDAASRRLLEPGSPLPGPVAAGLGFARRGYALHAPVLARAMLRFANGLIAIKSCNQAFWRDDLEAVNGFDEAMTGWGSEDKELCARLDNSGVRRQSLLFAALAWHLAHPPATREAAAVNRARHATTVQTGRTRCESGLDGHARPTPAISPSGAVDSTLL